MTYDEVWYLCEIREAADEQPPEPDWSKVPEAKRAHVRDRWLAANAVQVVSKVQLWGPQIPFFERQPGYAVTVIEKAVGWTFEEVSPLLGWRRFWMRRGHDVVDIDYRPEDGRVFCRPCAERGVSDCPHAAALRAHIDPSPGQTA